MNARSKQHPFAIAVTLLATLLFAGRALAGTVEIGHMVQATDNLYHADWGHWYTGSDEHGAELGRGTAPGAVGSDSGAAFNFAGLDSISISATGCATDDGLNMTGANGSLCGNELEASSWIGSDFRGFDAYSIIGVWSTTPDMISFVTIRDNFDTWDFRDALFMVGSGTELVVPTGFDTLYLFLADNDAYFADNSGYYDVTVSYNVSEVPLPGTGALIGVGLALLGLRGRRRTQ